MIPEDLLASIPKIDEPKIEETKISVTKPDNVDVAISAENTMNSAGARVVGPTDVETPKVSIAPKTVAKSGSVSNEQYQLPPMSLLARPKPTSGTEMNFIEEKKRALQTVLDSFNLDATVILQKPKLKPYITEIRENLSHTLNLPFENISIKAKTKEKVDAVGEGRAIESQASVLIEELDESLWV